jgi:hypothetical protein
MSTGWTKALSFPQTHRKPYIISYFATTLYHHFFKVNKSLGIEDARFLAQMSLQFICLMAITLQWPPHTYVGTGQAVQALLFN